MPWKPSVPGEVPTLGYYAIDWMVENLAAPGKLDYEPFTPYLEQEDFILRWYEINPETGRFKYQRGLLGRPRGWGKSPLLAALACFEALGDCLPDGWDADGQPVGRPWATVRTPLVHIAAVSEKQTRNTWQPLLEMLREGPVLDNYPGIDPLDTFVVLPRTGRIEQITAAPRTTKGAPIVFGTLDQTEEWVPSNNGPVLAQAIRTNAAKNGGRTVESPNAFIPGQHSVAEDSAAYAAKIAEGRAKLDSLLHDHREAPADTDLTDHASLIHGLRVAYGDSSAHPDGCLLHDPPCPPGHVELEPLVAQAWDPASDVQVIRSDLLNQVTHAKDSWVSEPEWNACNVETLHANYPGIRDGEAIVLGFDGSRGRNRGNADATALVGCRVEDGLVFCLDSWIWEPDSRDWVADTAVVDAAIRAAFRRWNVVGFFADPSGWTEQVARWEQSFGPRLGVKASPRHPIAAWPRGKDTQAVEYVELTRRAIVTRELRHNGPLVLGRHVIHARRRPHPRGYLLYKSYPDSRDKIDGAYALVMAWKARLEAIASGAHLNKRTGNAIFV